MAIVAVLFANAACSSQKASIVGCNALQLNAPFLVIPSPGATGVSTSIGTLYVGQVETKGTFSLEASGKTFDVGPISAIASPAPSAIPTDNPLSYFSMVAIPTLQPATTYTLSYKSPEGSQPCPSQVNGFSGTFTTQ